MGSQKRLIASSHALVCSMVCLAITRNPKWRTYDLIQTRDREGNTVIFNELWYMLLDTIAEVSQINPSNGIMLHHFLVELGLGAYMLAIISQNDKGVYFVLHLLMMNLR